MHRWHRAALLVTTALTPPAATRWRRKPMSARAVLLAVLAPSLILGVPLAIVSTGSESIRSTPATDSVEAGFARDMSAHHAQAVEMAELIRTRTRDPELRRLATDVSLTQQAQIGQMRGWLDVWGLRPTSTGPSTWMDMPAGAPMPGMATRAELNELAEAQGKAADAIFLSLMLEHHRGGVSMALHAVERSDEPVVDRLATAIAASQQAEQQVLRNMLAATGVSPSPETSRAQPEHREGH